MTTPSTSTSQTPNGQTVDLPAARRRADLTRRGRERWRVGPGLRLLLCSIAAVSGCTYTGGELLFLLGVGRGEKVEARFHLSSGPILILIDDPAERVDLPMANRNLFDDLAQELLRHKAAQRIIPQQTVDRLRQSVPDFERRGCREIGELAGAEQVLWIEVRDFLAEEQVGQADIAAFFTVSVKVINAHERKDRSAVRLWPTSPQGEVVSASMTGSEVAIAGTQNEIATALASRLAEKIAKLFYAHRLGEFERQG